MSFLFIPHQTAHKDFQTKACMWRLSSPLAWHVLFKPQNIALCRRDKANGLSDWYSNWLPWLPDFRERAIPSDKGI